MPENMAALTRYALLKPATLETVGKAVSGPQQGQLDVERVASGRWKELGDCSAKVDARDVKMRAVTEGKRLVALELTSVALFL